MGRFYCSIVLVVAVGATAKVSAQVALTWDAPPGCPGRDAVLLGVRDLITAQSAQEISARGSIRAADSGFHLDLETPHGTRSIAGTSCDELAEAAALILALIVDPGALRAIDSGDDVVEVRDRSWSTQAPAGETAAALSSSADAPERREGTRTYGVAIAPVLAIGALPSATGGIEVGATYDRERLRGSLGFLYLPRGAGRVEGQPQVGGTMRLLALTARLCGSFGNGRVQGGPCASVAIGAIHGRGFGVSDPTSGRAGWLTLGGGAYAALRVRPHMLLILQGDIDAPVRRGEFVIEEVGTVHRPSAVQARLGLFVEATFP